MSRPDFTRREFLAGAGAALALGCLPRGRWLPHVVCVNVDQLRKREADRLLTEVGALAASGGVAFDAMRTASPWTYPSVLSFLTGLLPQQHGADAHLFQRKLAHFDPAVPTLQKLLRAGGYYTAGFVTNPFLQTWNTFHHGFEHFGASFVGSQGNLRGFSKLVWKPDQMFSDSVNAGLPTAGWE